MANENGKTPTQAQPQMIPLSKIHELPGVFNPKPQDKSLGSMVLSIESSGIKEPVILPCSVLPVFYITFRLLPRRAISSRT